MDTQEDEITSSRYEHVAHSLEAVQGVSSERIIRHRVLLEGSMYNY